ncbi:MAG: beta-1,6-N-acetylglucosaminyltransferase [Oscillospiraceae bacterium]|nr:beta-1,6-N-acetylglucosaminyltransferase [Oscillospiraceae bacterium]
MKIAYLILCHRDPGQVSSLISSLDTPDTSFYIHIDRKCPDFAVQEKNNIYVIPYRLREEIKWASKEMVIATLKLIKAALDSPVQYDYIFLLSGQDYPLKSNADIITYLAANKGANYIEMISHDDPMYMRYRKRCDIFYPRFVLSSRKLLNGCKRLLIELTGGYTHTFRWAARRSPYNTTFEFGSQWWCLTEECLKWIYNYIEEHRLILDYFDHANVPDECLFQTVFAMSPYSSTRLDKLTYVDWDKTRRHPRILTSSDLRTLLNSGRLFARKFDCSIDSDITSMLEKERRRL